MGQRASAVCGRLIAMSTEKDSGLLGTMQSGDVLVSHSTAVLEHEISIVPNAPHATSPTHDVAVRGARAEADATGVDAWLTEDQTHVVKISSHRGPGE
jgi:hypothetical protein